MSVSTPQENPRDEIACLYTSKSIYDGWSVAEMNDGSFINRWPVGDRRHLAAEKYRLAIIESKKEVSND